MSTSKEATMDDIYALMDQQGKASPTTSTVAFLGTVLVGVPVWLTVVLPLSIVSQITKALLVKPFVSPPVIEDVGIEIPSSIVPREKRKYDVVVLGATGFTGRLVVEHLAKTYGVNDKVKWAMAGRSKSKLDQVQNEISDRLGVALDIDTILVDTTIASDLPALVMDTRAVITTAGPFQKYGSSVVEACAKFGTHYVDITGEVDWVKIMMSKWESTAQETGAKIVSLCGHDSVPWDLTVYKLQEALPNGEELVTVDCLNEIVGDVSGGTIDTVMLSTTTNAVRPPQTDYDLFLQLPNGTKSTSTSSHAFPLLVKKSVPINGRFASSFTSCFAMSVVNAEVVKRSVALNQASKNVVYNEYQVHPDFKTAFCAQVGTLGFITALLNPVTKFLLQKVLPKPGQGPSRQVMETTHFLTVSAQGVGSKGSVVQSVMYFPRDAGYMDTARMVAESGLSLSLDSAKLSPEGGFFSPATGMGSVLLDRLCRTGTHYAIKSTTKQE